MQTFDSYEDRKHLTFAQAEGVEPLPSQLKRDQISNRLRIKLWNCIQILFQYKLDIGDLILYKDDNEIIFRYLWIEYFDTFEPFPRPRHFEAEVERIFQKGSYIELFGFLQALIRCPSCPLDLVREIDKVLEVEFCAFRIVNDDTFCPVGGPFEAEAIRSAIEQTSKQNLHGARTHLLEAAKRATAGEFAPSIRESISAVESVARVLGSAKDSLNQALAKLETAGVIHGAMKAGFGSLYGYTSDEKGIRHPLLEDGAAQVTEADALFMLGACASFVTYMITRARAADLLTDA